MVYSSCMWHCLFCGNPSLWITYNALLDCLGFGLSAGVSGCFSPVCHSLLFSNSAHQSHFQKCLQHILQKGDRLFVHLCLGVCVSWAIIEKNEYFMTTHILLHSCSLGTKSLVCSKLSWKFKHIYSSLKARHGYIFRLFVLLLDHHCCHLVDAVFWIWKVICFASYVEKSCLFWHGQ